MLLVIALPVIAVRLLMRRWKVSWGLVGFVWSSWARRALFADLEPRLASY